MSTVEMRLVCSLKFTEFIEITEATNAAYTGGLN